jgi:hypothetical protein
MAMPTEETFTFLHHLPYVHGSSGWLPYSWGWRHNLSKKTDLSSLSFLFFANFHGYKVNLKTLPEAPLRRGALPGQGPPPQGRNTPLRATRTNERAPPRTGWPPLRSVSGASSEATAPATRRTARAGGSPPRLQLPRTTTTKHHGGALHVTARTGHRSRDRPLAGRGRQGAPGATEGSRPRRGHRAPVIIKMARVPCAERLPFLRSVDVLRLHVYRYSRDAYAVTLSGIIWLSI